MQTRDQRYAGKIFEQAEVVKRDYTKEQQDRYGSMAHNLPVLIRQAGLAQAVGFVEARGKDEQKRLLDDLAKTLGYNDRADYAAKVRSADLSRYMFMTQDALAALLWYKRFAQTVLGVQAPVDSDMEEA